MLSVSDLGKPVTVTPEWVLSVIKSDLSNDEKAMRICARHNLAQMYSFLKENLGFYDQVLTPTFKEYPELAKELDVDANGEVSGEIKKAVCQYRDSVRLYEKAFGKLDED